MQVSSLTQFKSIAVTPKRGEISGHHLYWEETMAANKEQQRGGKPSSDLGAPESLRAPKFIPLFPF